MDSFFYKFHDYRYNQANTNDYTITYNWVMCTINNFHHWRKQFLLGDTDTFRISFVKHFLYLISLLQ